MKRFLLILFFSSLGSLSASDYLTIEKQNDEMDKAIYKPPLHNQEEINSEVARIAIETYKNINENWTYVQADKRGSIESSYWRWEILSLGSHHVPTAVFQGEAISQLFPALKDIVLRKASLECLTAGKAVRSIALAKILGKNSFMTYVDQLFFEKSLELFSPGLYNQLPYGKGIGEKPFYQPTCKREKGHFVYITNIPDYSNIVDDGASRGQNVVCVGNNQYIGFGERFKDGPLSEEQIAENFYTDLGKHAEFHKRYPTKDSYLEARLKHQKAFDASYQYGYFNADLIKKFLNRNGEFEDTFSS
ncbi:hypothetical protein [Candidatus Finniella inopinata]|uniref:Uncharacterized protein n=1 Tax=Candidatus Finniella inopinata TaxID=1696036 RepID=A0A4Q7DIQ7_9PROT|nr:hypothetical protein [Candidatus Finniella inopinata]RZI45874.1 hypothetical protein EQU50_05430 [Candidatus Finniella inopinata]